MGKEENRQGCHRICFPGRCSLEQVGITRSVMIDDVPGCCAALLPPLCAGVASVMGAGLALKHGFDLLGFFGLWTTENAAIIGLQPGQGIDTAQCRGSAGGLCFSQKDLGRKDAILEKITALPIN